MTISPGLNGFIKGILLAVILAAVSFLGNEANLTGWLNPAVATIVVAIASAIESSIKARSDKGLFGAVRVR